MIRLKAAFFPHNDNHAAEGKNNQHGEGHSWDIREVDHSISVCAPQRFEISGKQHLSPGG